MHSMKLVIPLHSLYWSMHTKDESKSETAFAFIFGVNWLWRRGATTSFGVSFHEINCNGITGFTEYMTSVKTKLQAIWYNVWYFQLICIHYHSMGPESLGLAWLKYNLYTLISYSHVFCSCKLIWVQVIFCTHFL